ncbi:MAG: DUF4169 family protein [Pseudomonadota bacterium]|uniref:DUF4169 family protein n=1 Tax=Sphingobium sp. TaxID=1912891 RepID=UPI002E1A57B2
MSNVINLRQARKAKVRADKARAAEANRAKFGRTKAERTAQQAEEARREAVIEGARLEAVAPIIRESKSDEEE